ncbi:MAG: EF-hand domain-containing protein [Pseudomonadota bacterium]
MKKGAPAYVGVLAALLAAFVWSGLARAEEPPPLAPPGGGKSFIGDFDRDKDGKVSREEFLGPAEQFKQLDRSGDGFIDAAEAPQGPPPRGKKPDFIGDLDRDKDGKVSREEFPGPPEHFKQLDRSGDGFIDAAEAPQGPPPRGKKPDFIGDLDRDKDGKVSREEFFTKIDRNGDGFITADEAPPGGPPAGPGRGKPRGPAACCPCCQPPPCHAAGPGGPDRPEDPEN